MARLVPFLLALVPAFVAGASGAADDLGRWHGGAYTYSDEMGGFIIHSVTGTGQADDPVVITHEMLSASPVTLVIRAIGAVRPRVFNEGVVPNGFIHMRIVALNNSGLPWVEYEFELQEQRGEPSTFGDGLSFDQRRTDSTYISSDRYAEFSREYEPYDRIRFFNGHTDPLETATFEFLITDFTPVSEFYLVQDPTIPFS